MSYFEESATLPPPFNIFPTPKLLLKMLGLRKKDKLRKMKMKEQKEKEHDVRYTAVMRALVWRYVSAMHRKMDDEPVTEDDINELKGDVSALRYELLEVFEKNGMDVSFTDRKEKMVLGKRMKVWERRLMKDFHVAPVALDEEKPADEDGLSRFRRIAKLAVANTSNAKWDQTLASTGISSQIGRCRSRESFKNQQNLQRAMEEARKLVLRSPLPEGSRVGTPIEMPISPGHTLLELIKDISTEVGETEPEGTTSPPKSPWKPPGEAGVPGIAVGALLSAADARSRPVSPKPATSTAPSPIPGPSTAASPVPAKTPPKCPSPVPTSRVASPVPPTVSPTGEGTTSPQPDPSPLKAKRVPGDSPPKVIKRKPSGPPSPSGGPAADKPEETDTKPVEAIAVARPVAPEIKPSEGAIPPPPPPVKPKAPQAPTMEVTPSTPPVHAPSPPEAKPPSPPKAAAKPPSPPKTAGKPPSPPKVAPPPPRTPSPQPSTSAKVDPSPPSPPKRLTSTSSTEQLIPPSSPEPLRPAKKLDEIKTIKRQQKTGWL
ncbi:hypothetical protein B5X24_HaOG209949 [Helicoverpa armigera]|uniref:Uncharacterized protein n=1 Tax=Helicoverpa armigera TaxID=29058 RepID=A0A2W1BEA8_HELAM|nr:hypothetical protein B5X24_HaOG209949 [Helicoverpa armigera]